MTHETVRASRSGFGTTASLVLVILGVALFILVLQNLFTRGSSISIGRAYAAAQLLRVGHLSIDDAFESKLGKETLRKTLTANLVKAASGLSGAGPVSDATPADRDLLVKQFLSVIRPTSDNGGPVDTKLAALFDVQPPPDKVEMLLGPGSADVPVKGAYWVQKAGLPDRKFDVLFSSDPAYVATYKPATVNLAYKSEIEQGILKVEDVQMRVVAFRERTEIAQGSPLTPTDYESSDLEAGRGIVRARIQLTWVLPKDDEGHARPLHRTVTEDRRFTLYTPAAPPNANPPPAPSDPDDLEWRIEVNPTEWQKGATES